MLYGTVSEMSMHGKAVKVALSYTEFNVSTGSQGKTNSVDSLKVVSGTFTPF
jgi:hypothetical protein